MRGNATALQQSAHFQQRVLLLANGQLDDAIAQIRFRQRAIHRSCGAGQRHIRQIVLLNEALDLVVEMFGFLPRPEVPQADARLQHFIGVISGIVELVEELARVGVVTDRLDAKWTMLAFFFGVVLPARETFVLDRLLSGWLSAPPVVVPPVVVPGWWAT